MREIVLAISQWRLVDPTDFREDREDHEDVQKEIKFKEVVLLFKQTY